MAENKEFKDTVETLIGGMESFMSSKTVVGEAIKVGDTTILPLMDVAFGVGAGANQSSKNGPNSEFRRRRRRQDESERGSCHFQRDDQDGEREEPGRPD